MRFDALTSEDLCLTRLKFEGQATGVAEKSESLSAGSSAGGAPTLRTDGRCVYKFLTLCLLFDLLTLFVVSALRWSAMVAPGVCVLQFGCVRTTGLAHTRCCCCVCQAIVRCLCKCKNKKAKERHRVAQSSVWHFSF